MSTRPNRDRVWGALSLNLPHHLDGDVTAGLRELAIGSESTTAGRDRTKLRIYLRSPSQAEQALAQLTALLRGLGVEAKNCNIRVERLPDGRWAEKYQASLRPFRIGERFVVIPAGEGAAASALIPLMLVPGRAFGTGEHPTTRLCVRLLEDRVRQGSRWLDIGCGSAILSMVAHHCGAAQVLAMDNDPEAVEVAREVLRANGLLEAINLMRGSIEACGHQAWNGVVANISGFFTLTRLGEMAAMLAPGALLIASGFQQEESVELKAQMRRCGLRPGAELAEEGWAAIEATRAEGAV